MGTQCEREVGLNALGIKAQSLDVADEGSDSDPLQDSDRDQIAREGKRFTQSGRAIKLAAVILGAPDFGGRQIIEDHGRVVNDG